MPSTMPRKKALISCKVASVMQKLQFGIEVGLARVSEFSQLAQRAIDIKPASVIFNELTNLMQTSGLPV